VKVLIWAQDFDQTFALLDQYLPDLDLPGWKENLKGWERKRVYAYSMRGEAHMDAGNEAAAIPDLELALAYYQEQAREQPDSAQVHTQLLRVHHNLSQLHTALENWPVALEHAQAGRSAGQLLVSKGPRDAAGRRNLAIHDQQVGKLLSKLGRYAEAQESMDIAIATYRELAQADADNNSLVRDLAIALTDAGDVAAAVGSASDGCPNYRDANALWQQLEKTSEISEYNRVNGVQVTLQRIEERCL